MEGQSKVLRRSKEVSNFTQFDDDNHRPNATRDTSVPNVRLIYSHNILNQNLHSNKSSGYPYVHYKLESTDVRHLAVS